MIWSFALLSKPEQRSLVLAQSGSKDANENVRQPVGALAIAPNIDLGLPPTDMRS
jgi:hypothetical protein